MGVVHSVDSCSSGHEWKKDDLLRTPSNQELVEYEEMEQRAAQKHQQQQQQQRQHHQRRVPRSIPDANRSVQRQLGVKFNDSSRQSPSISSPSFRRGKQNLHHQDDDVHHQQENDHQDNHQNDHARTSSTWTRLRQKSVRRVRQASSSMVGKVTHAASTVSHGTSIFFQHIHPNDPQPTHHNNNNSNNSPRNSRHKRQNSSSRHSRRMFHFTLNTTTASPSTTTVVPKVRGGVWLRGCWTDDEHKQMARGIVERLRPLQGAKALEECGLEYRMVQLDEHGQIQAKQLDHDNNSNDKEKQLELPAGTDPPPELVEETIAQTNPVKSVNSYDDKPSEAGPVDVSIVSTSNGYDDYGGSHHCSCQTEDSKPVSVPNNGSTCTCICKQAATKMTRLFHKESNTMITMKNRKEFIADGDMYDAIARVAQEYAQEVMIRDGDLEWVTICEAGNNPEPIRALVSRRLLEDESRLDQEPTLLIATGKGKVRAGIFSREHLLTSGLECSTAVPIVREARKRNMMMVVVDPNVHGDRLGMVTFEKSMERMFRRWESNNSGTNIAPPLSQKDLFVLSHSQSGAQLARYLLDKSEHYIPHLRAVAFTDSTHNIQWAKSKDLQSLKEFLESDDCVYFKCSNNARNDPLLNPLSSLGKQVETDEFWKHRFGNIRTICAGTSEHSLTNWFARCHIWEHFDKHLTLSNAVAPQIVEDPTSEQTSS